MAEIRGMLSGSGTVLFADLFREAGDREEVVTSFLALLELIREALVEVVQSEPYAPIHLKGRGGAARAEEPSVIESTPAEESEAS